MERFTTNVAQGASATLGQAILQAKRDYALAQFGNLGFTQYDEKILAEATLYGLPMFQVNTPNTSGPTRPAVPDGWTTLKVSTNALPSVDYTLNINLTLSETLDGQFYENLGLSHREDGEPIQPLWVQEFQNNLGFGHGIVLVSGAYADTSNFNPVIESAHDLSSVAQITGPFTEPTFSATGWYPAALIAQNTLARPDGAREKSFVGLLGQYNSALQTERLYTNLQVRVYYSASSDFTPPTIVSVAKVPGTNQLQLRAAVTDTSGIFEIVVPYNRGLGRWDTLNLTDSDGDGVWTGDLPVTTTVEYFLQIVDNAGNVTLDNNVGLNYVTAPGATTTTASGVVDPNAGGGVTSPDGAVTALFPANAVNGAVNLLYTQQATTTQALGNFAFAGHTFQLGATDGNGHPVTEFNQSYTLTIHYADSDWQNAGLTDEANLNLVYWDGAGWVLLLPCAGCGVDTVNNVLTVVLDHFTEFALVGSQYPIYLPFINRGASAGRDALKLSTVRAVEYA